MRGSPGETGSSAKNHRAPGGTPRAQVCHARACRALVPEVLPAVMPDRPAVPEFLPAPLPGAGAAGPAAGGPAGGRACRAGRGAGRRAARRQAPGRGELVREAVPCRWDEAEIARLRGFLRTVDDLRGRQGRVYPLEYLLALPLAAGMAGDGEAGRGSGMGRDGTGGAAGEAGRAAGPGGKAAPPGRDDHRPRPRRL